MNVSEIERQIKELQKQLEKAKLNEYETMKNKAVNSRIYSYKNDSEFIVTTVNELFDEMFKTMKSGWKVCLFLGRKTENNIVEYNEDSLQNRTELLNMLKEMDAIDLVFMEFVLANNKEEIVKQAIPKYKITDEVDNKLFQNNSSLTKEEKDRIYEEGKSFRLFPE